MKPEAVAVAVSAAGTFARPEPEQARPSGNQ